MIFNDCQYLGTSQDAVFKTGEEDFKCTAKLGGPFAMQYISGLTVERNISHH